nr:endogenous retrovirus group K member 5 Gag polyprotein-like [Microcebus murinus]
MKAFDNNDNLGGFSLFPVIQEEEGDCQYHRPLPIKQLKELKVACTQYGPTAPFTEALLDSLAAVAMPPDDWKNIAKACLSGGDNLLWKSEFHDQCHAIAGINRAQGIHVTFDMLAGEGEYRFLEQQLAFLPAAYAQTNAAAMRAWRKLPSSQKSEDLSKIRQGPDEPYQDFVSRLLEATKRLVNDSDTEALLVKQLAFKNANSACQAAIRPFKKRGTLEDFIQLCADIGPSYMQGITLAAALQGKSVKQLLFQQQTKKGNSKQPKVAGPPGSCYNCGQLGHRAAQCPKPHTDDPPKKLPGLCPRCKKGNHWARNCKSTTDVHGNKLAPRQGNWKRGQPLAPQQCYGALQRQPLQGESQNQGGNPFVTSSEQPQAAQD